MVLLVAIFILLMAGRAAWAQGVEATPVLQMQAGATTTQYNVIVSSPTPGAVIHYTTNGIDPTVTDPTIPSGSGGAVVNNSVVKVKAWDGNTPAVLSPSAVATAVYSPRGRVAAGEFHTIVMRFDGRVMAAGRNGSGQLGDGTTTDRYAQGPVLKSSAPNDVFQDAVSIAGGNSAGSIYGHTLAAKSDGTVWAWGANTYGELGNGTTTNSSYPVQILKAAGQPLTGVIAVSAGYYSSYALLSDGTVWAWGYNGYGNLGDGTTTNRSYAVQMMLN